MSCVKEQNRLRGCFCFLIIILTSLTPAFGQPNFGCSSVAPTHDCQALFMKFLSIMHRWPGAGAAVTPCPSGQPINLMDDSKTNGLKCLLGTQQGQPSAWPDIAKRLAREWLKGRP